MRTIVLNTLNLVPNGQNNQLIYKFPNSVSFKDNYIAVQSVVMYYSWYNISAAIGNNKCSYIWYSGATQLTRNIIIPDGIYDVAALNAYFQFYFLQVGDYLVNSSGNNVFYFNFEINPSAYAVQLCTYQVPTALPPGYTNPSGFVLPTQKFNPSFIFAVATVNALGQQVGLNTILGYPSGWSSGLNLGGATAPYFNANVTLGKYFGVTYSYTLATGTQGYLSSTAPNITPNASAYISISAINNPYALPSSIIYSVTPTNGIGRVILSEPPQFSWNRLIDGNYNQLTVTILGVDLQPLLINDPSISIMLTIRDGTESFTSK